MNETAFMPYFFIMKDHDYIDPWDLEFTRYLNFSFGRYTWELQASHWEDMSERLPAKICKSSDFVMNGKENKVSKFIKAYTDIGIQSICPDFDSPGWTMFGDYKDFHQEYLYFNINRCSNETKLAYEEPCHSDEEIDYWI